MLVAATVRPRQYPTVQCAAMATGPMNVEFASVTRADWVRSASARRRNIVRPTMPIASQILTALYAVEEETAYVDSAPAMQLGLVRSGESTVNVTISTVCISKELFALVSMYKFFFKCFSKVEELSLMFLTIYEVAFYTGDSLLTDNSESNLLVAD